MLLEATQLRQRTVKFLSSLFDDFRELNSTFGHFAHVEHVEAEHNVFNLIEHRVKRTRQLDNVFALNRRDKLNSRVLENCVVDLVATIFQLMHACNQHVNIGIASKAFNGLDKHFGFLNRQSRHFLECLEVIERISFRHGRS